MDAHRPLVLLEAGVHPLEVKAVADHPAGLVHRVSKLMQVHFRYNVKAWHNDSRTVVINQKKAQPSAVQVALANIAG